jgi:exodeoxyribonuclease V alpha subunit
MKNDYNIAWEKADGELGVGIFNGDIGFIEDIDKASGVAKLKFDSRYAYYSRSKCVSWNCRMP